MQGEIFGHVLAERRVPRRGLAASVSLHLLVIAVMAAWRFIGPMQHLKYRLENEELQIVRYNLPEPLLFAGAGRQGGGGGAKGGGGGGSAGGSGAAGSRQPGRVRIQLPAPPRIAQQGLGPAPAAMSAAPAAIPAPATAAPKPAFVVPQKEVSRHRDLVIQPDFSPEVRIQGRVQLPNLFLWTEQEMRPIERQLKTFVLGERKRVPRNPTALPDAAPKIEVPNREVKVADLKMGWQPALPKRPALPVFQANTTPVRVERQALDAPAELPAPALPAGQPVNLLAMMERPAPPAASYSVEGGNRFPTAEAAGGGGGAEKGAGGGVGAATAGAGAGGGEAASGTGAVAGIAGGTGPGGAGAGAAAGTGADGTGAAGAGGAGGGSGVGAAGAGGGGRTGTGSGSGASGLGTGLGGTGSGTGRGAGTGAGGRGLGSGSGSGTGTGAGTGSGSGAGSGTGGRGTGSGSGAGGSGRGAGSRPGGVGTGIDAGGFRLGADSVAINTESPNTSTFDVVVVHHSARDLMSEGPGLLTGQPIYTVYLVVPGSRREWILQWAVPYSREPVQQRTENSVQLGAATPVRPPYPLRKGLLDVGDTRGLEGRVVIYGAISNKGALENLRIIRGVRDEIDTAVLACLRQFVFRPAVRDGLPVLVEALFGVPLN